MRGAVSRMFMVSPCLADPDGRSRGSRPRSASLLPRRLYCQELGVRNEGVRDYFVAMIRVFRCGDLEVRGFTDGILKTSLDFVLGMERAASEELVGGTNDGSLFIPVNNFLFQRDGATMLIDAGAGKTMQPTLGKLPANLNAAGIDPADVTHSVLTHMHPDHANGLVDAAGGAVYPNAEILVHAQELDFWMTETNWVESDAVKRTRARNKLNMKPYLERIRRMH